MGDFRRFRSPTGGLLVVQFECWQFPPQSTVIPTWSI